MSAKNETSCQFYIDKNIKMDGSFHLSQIVMPIKINCTQTMNLHKS